MANMIDHSTRSVAYAKGLAHAKGLNAVQRGDTLYVGTRRIRIDGDSVSMMELDAAITEAAGRVGAPAATPTAPEAGKPPLRLRTAPEGAKPAKAEPETIDMTPAWAAVAEIYMTVLESSTNVTALGAARDELRRMARLADAYVKSRKA